MYLNKVKPDGIGQEYIRTKLRDTSTSFLYNKNIGTSNLWVAIDELGNHGP